MARTLLEAGADPTTEDTACRTPMHDAAKRGYVEMVRVLLDAGVDAAAKGSANGR